MTDSITAYLSSYPGISLERARENALGQGARIQLLEAIGTGGIEGFGGSWFEATTGVFHLFVTDEAAQSAISQLAENFSATPTYEPAAYDYADLVSLANEINASRSPEEAQSDVVFAGADNELNRVAVVAGTPAMADAMRAKFANDPRIVIKEIDASAYEYTACSTRTACGSPARSGIVIGIDADGSGSGSATQNRSLGFTAVATDGSKWIVTAGHGVVVGTSCPSDDACWGHGQQFFGPMRQATNSGNVDMGRIRLDSTYWATGGWMYFPFMPNTPVAVDAAITARIAIQRGDVVCLSAWHVPSTAQCGTILRPVGHRGMVEALPNACAGDSGGGWWAPVGSHRWAFGIQSSSEDPALSTCHTPGNKRSVFAAIPDINVYWDANSAATIRVEGQNPCPLLC